MTSFYITQSKRVTLGAIFIGQQAAPALRGERRDFTSLRRKARNTNGALDRDAPDAPANCGL